MSEQHDDGATVALTEAAPPVPAAAPMPDAVEPAQAEAPAVEIEPVAEVPAAEAPAEGELKPHTEEAGLLSAEAPEKPDENSTEPAKAEETEQTPVEVVEYDLKTPEGLEIDADRLGKFKDVARELNIAPERAQGLLDMHVEALQTYEAALRQQQHDTFAETRRGWKNQILGDPEMGGSGFQTNLAKANRMLAMFTPPEHRKALNEALMVTGAADHPEFFRLMLNVARRFDEPAPPPQAPKPPPNIGRPPSRGAGARLNYAYPRGGNNGR